MILQHPHRWFGGAWCPICPYTEDCRRIIIPPNTSGANLTAVSYSLLYLQCISLIFTFFHKDDATPFELAKEHTDVDVSAAVQRERAEILISLRKIMETMKSERGGVGGASIGRKEIEQLKAENK